MHATLDNRVLDAAHFSELCFQHNEQSKIKDQDQFADHPTNRRGRNIEAELKMPKTTNRYPFVPPFLGGWIETFQKYKRRRVREGTETVMAIQKHR